MKKILQSVLLSVVCRTMVLTCEAQAFPDFSDQPVLDQVHMLTAEQTAHLVSRIEGLAGETSMQIRLVIMADVSPEPTASAYAEKLYHYWKLGDKEKHNGLLILIARKIGTDSREQKDFCRIMTGWGIQKIIPDSVVIQEIKHQYLMPNMRDPFVAFDRSLDRIVHYIAAWQVEHPEDRTIRSEQAGARTASSTNAVASASAGTDGDPSGSGSLPIIVIMSVLGGGVLLVVWYIIASSGSSSTSDTAQSIITPSYYSSTFNDPKPSVVSTAPKKKAKSSDSGGCSSSTASSGCSSSAGASCGGGGGGCGGGGCGGGGCGS